MKKIILIMVSFVAFQGCANINHKASNGEVYKFNKNGSFSIKGGSGDNRYIISNKKIKIGNTVF